MLTVTQASAVNVLCNYLAPGSSGRTTLVHDSEAREALALLAGDASSKLMAGASRVGVERHWPAGEPPRPFVRRERVRRRAA